MVELVVQVGHHVSGGAALTEGVDPPDEVRDDLAEGVAVPEGVPRVQHALVQDHPQVIPPLVVPGRRRRGFLSLKGTSLWAKGV